MRKHFIILFFIFIKSIYSQNEQDLNTFVLPAIEIVSKKEIPFIEKHFYGTDYNSSIFDKNGFDLVRRGSNFTQDLYVEGFKKGNIKIVVDGERYHNACPNRMDAPSTRLNLIEMSSVDLTKSASTLNSGIYGKVESHRTNLDKPITIKSLVSGNVGAQNDIDASLMAEGFY